MIRHEQKLAAITYHKNHDKARKMKTKRLLRRRSLSSSNLFAVRSIGCCWEVFVWYCIGSLISCFMILETITAINTHVLLGGRYVTKHDVKSYLNLALDIAKMNEADDFDSKLDIYTKGSSENSITLQSLSLTANDDMQNNPFYHQFRYTFWDLGYNRENEDDGYFDGAPVEVYADTIVRDLFSLDVRQIESEAALVMNVWMASVNGIFEALAQCRNANPDEALIALDTAVALWVGAGQVDGSNEEGHMLYNLAENAGELFDQDIGETAVNKFVMKSFLIFQLGLTSKGSCNSNNNDDDKEYKALRKTVHRLVGMMTVPLVQNLIHHTMNVDNEGGSDRVELYALGIIPRLLTCNPAAYESALKLDVLNNLNAGDEDKAINAIQQAYSCLGLTCADVGSYMGGVFPACSDNDSDNDGNSLKLGLYEIFHENDDISSLISKAHLDRDIKQIDVFLKYHSRDVALDWYTHGWNSDITLRDLALNEFIPKFSDPSGIPTYYSLFTDYYESPYFIHNQITSMLRFQGDSVYEVNKVSDEQIRNAVVGLLKNAVMFVASVDSLKYASWVCFNGNQKTSEDRIAAAIKYIKTGAMFYIGSMEGDDMGSLEKGESMFAFAKELCVEFGTCVDNRDGAAEINELIVTTMAQVTNDIDAANSCKGLNTVINDILLPAMAVPLVQGLVKYAFHNEKLPKGTDAGDLAFGDTISRGVLPLINTVSPDSAEIIRSQMKFQLGAKPVPDGFKAVSDALGEAVPLMNVSCKSLGVPTYKSFDGYFCATDDGPNLPQTSTSGSSKSSSLVFGRYEFADLKSATIEASFALDVRDMFDAVSVTEAKAIYQDGANALESKLFGYNVDATPTLASLSTQAAPVMSDDLFFNIYKYALYEDTDFEGSSLEDFSYANDVVLEALTVGTDNKLAAEATVVLQVFMVIIHKLHSAVRICNNGASPESEISSAVALWVGANQGEGKFDDGWMLYSIGQSVQKFFGFPEGEAPINSKLMELFIEAQTAARNCPVETTEAAGVIRSLSHAIIRSLTQPLIKSLFFHMAKNSKFLVEMYAVAVIPQAAACNAKAYSEIRTALYSGYDKSTSLTDDLMDHLGTFLKCQRITCEDIFYGANADGSLVDMIDRLCDRLNFSGINITQPFLLAGYLPQIDVKNEARLDLDALEMYMMMRTEAYEAAAEVYYHGHNSVANDSINTLSALETFFDRDKDYVPKKLISDALSQTGEYATTATRGQLAEIVRRILQTMVSFNAVLAYMESSVKECQDGSIEKAKRDWDQAAAYFVGSIEGPLASGQANGQGEWMYALGNEFCDEFSSCETSGGASVNEQIMFQLATGRDSLADGQCAYLVRTVPRMFISKMVVPLIQGTISASMKLDNDGYSSDPELIATAHIFSRAIKPFVEEIEPDSGSLLSQNFASLSSSAQSNPSIFDLVELFSGVLGDLGVNCDDIGTLSGYYLCSTTTTSQSSGTGSDINEVPAKDTPTNLADNLYVTTTYVKDRSDIALDLKDISEALSAGNNELAQLIYRKGKNSEEFDANGKFVKIRSLQSLSTKSTNDMLDEPEFNMYMYTLGDQFYADKMVEKALEDSKIANPDVATEAVMILNVWMEIVHLMHKTLQACKEKKLHDDSGVHSMDAAVAYWIGDGQIAGDSENGHLLYALSERFGEAFDIDYGGQSRTNTNILRLFNKAKNEVSLPNACSESQTTYKKLRGIVNRLISLMVIPLIQGLITSLRANDKARVNIYAHAFVPIVAGCSRTLFNSLNEKLLLQTINVVEVENVIDLIRQTYDCLGLMCDDIGVHESERVNEAPDCNDPKINSHLAGYKPSNDVREYARLDLDIREMDVLLQMKAYSAAENLYSFGKHARVSDEVSLSIGEFATTKHRSIVPEYDVFVRYYEKDTYADEIIRTSLDPLQQSWTDEQRRVVAIKSTQVLVMYFAALQNAYEAVSDCESAQKLDLAMESDSWDKAAAILIGSLEGTKENGTDEGYMFYDLAQQYCQEFGTCLDSSTGIDANEQLVSLLFTGRGASLENSCRALKKAADEISTLLLIPIIQGALSTSTQLAKNENLQARAEGYVYSRALSPFVRKRTAANNFDSYLGNPTQADRRNMAAKTYSALATAYPDMNVDCEQIGIANGIDSCSGVVYVTDYIWIVVGVLLGVLSICCCGTLFCIRKKRRLISMKLPENNPNFVPSNGELNHSMDLLEKAFSSKQFDGDDNSPNVRDNSEEMEALNNSDREYEDSSRSDDDDDDNHDDFHDEISALTSKEKKTKKHVPDII